MRIVYEIRERLRALLSRADEDHQTAEELRFHIERQVEENLRSGMSPEEARRQAALRLGGATQVREATRDARGIRWLDDLARDLRYALRTFGRSPGFAAAAVLTLALGIGATTAIFSVVHPLLLNPLPFEGGDRMVRIWIADPSSGMRLTPMDAVVDAWRRDARTLEGFETIDATPLRRTGPDGAELVPGMRVSHTFLRFLGLRPALGRMFTEDEVRTGADVVLLGHDYWRREFGGTADVLGKAIELGGRPHTIIGVMPARVAAVQDGDLWVPLPPAEGGMYPGGPNLARIRPGVADSVVEAELDAIAERVHKSKRWSDSWVPRLMHPQELLGSNLTNALRVLSVAVALVLLIASANVAHLLLARAVARQREIAVRAALGADRLRVARQLLTESALLGVAGGALGLLFARWGVAAILGLRPAGLDDLSRAGISPVVVAFCLGVSVLTVVLFGIVPAIRAGRTDAGGALRSGPGGTTDRAGVRFRRGLVVAEVALTIVLLVGAGLLIRGLVRLQTTDPGFHAEGILIADVALPASRYTSEASMDAFRDRLLARVHAIPGVSAATTALSAPPDYGFMRGAPEVEGGNAGDATILYSNFVRADYFRTLGIPILEGRAFTADEVATRAPVIIVSETTARRLWRGARDAVGGRIRFSEGGRWLTVVGVARDVAAAGLLGDSFTRLQVHQPYRRFSGGGPGIGRVIVRAEDADAAAAAIRQAVREIDPEVPIRDLATAESELARSLAGPRFNAALLATFAALALVLAAVGLYGVLAYGVRSRTREFGIRKAVGAPGGAIVRAVVVEALVPVSLGTAIGLAGALAAGRAIESLLHGFPARDPATLLAAAAVILATTIVASLAPARRALGVDAMVALRAE